MLLVLLVVFFPILVLSIGKLSSGFWDISVVLQIWNCVLELGNLFFVVTQILIWQGMLILGNLLLAIWLPLQGELWLGNLDCKSVLHCLQLRLSSLLPLRHVKSYFGWRNLCKNLFFNNGGMFYFVIVKVFSSWQESYFSW